MLELKELAKDVILRPGKNQLAKEKCKSKKFSDILNIFDKENNGKRKYQNIFEQINLNPRYIEEIKAHHQQRELWKAAAKLYLQRL